jgi:Small metal-binding protein
MKTLSYSLFAGLIFIAGNSVAYAAQDEHAIEAEQHLEQAAESGKKGDAKGAAAHTEEAQKHVIEENKEKPYTPQSKQIYGENPKAEHDKAAFEEIGKAKGHAKKGEAAEAAGHAKNAETHLKEKEQAK